MEFRTEKCAKKNEEKKRNEWNKQTRKESDTWRKTKQQIPGNIRNKLCNGHLIKRINTCILSLIRYSLLILKWTRQGHRQLQKMTIELTRIHNNLHPREDTYLQNASRKEKRRVLAIIEDCINAKIQGIEEDTKKSKGRLNNSNQEMSIWRHKIKQRNVENEN